MYVYVFWRMTHVAHEGNLARLPFKWVCQRLDRVYTVHRTE